MIEIDIHTVFLATCSPDDVFDEHKKNLTEIPLCLLYVPQYKGKYRLDYRAMQQFAEKKSALSKLLELAL